MQSNINHPKKATLKVLINSNLALKLLIILLPSHPEENIIYQY